MFRPFERVGDSEHRTGVGLGLAVARGFVEAVGGDLDVDDTPGGGCTMVVRLPAIAPADHEAGSDPDGVVAATAGAAVEAVREPEVASDGKTEESQ